MLQPQKASFDAGLHQSYAVREKLVCGTVEESRIMSALRSTDYRGKIKSLGYDTPDQVYRTASGGGAKIVDKYSEKKISHTEIETKKETENRGSAVPLHEEGYPLKLDVLLS